jgi:protein TonB
MTFETDGLWAKLLVWLRQLNWFAIGIALALEGIFLAALISMGVVSVTKTEKRELTVLDIRASRPEPAAPPAPSQPSEPKPTPQQQPKTEVVVPQPKIPVQTANTPIPVAVEAPTPQVSAPPSQNPAPAAPTSGSGPVNVANLNTNLLSGAPPSYPMGSRRKREQGTVVLRLVISEDGRVSDVSIHRSSGFSALDEAAVAAVRKWRWSPTIRDGQRVQITGLVQIPFVLKES